jgi:prenyltransferase beta subunit
MNPSESDALWHILSILGKATAWLVGAQKENGSWGRFKEDGEDIFGTYIGVWALSEIGMADTEYVKKAIGWFGKVRRSDGSWGGSIDSTARGLITFLSHEDYAKELTQRSVEFLLKQKHENGGWPREIGTEEGSEIVQLRGASEIGATLPIITALSLTRVRFPEGDVGLEAEKHLRSAINWLKKSQNMDGSWAHFGRGESDVLATAWALRILVDAGEKANSVFVQRGVDFLLLNQNEDGSWGRRKGQKEDVVHTYNAVHSLILSGKELKMKQVQESFRWLFARQNSDGSWGAEKGSRGLVRFTASMIIIISRALKKEKLTVPLSTVFRISLLLGLQITRPVKMINRRLNLYSSKNMIIFAAGFAILAFLLGVSFLPLSNNIILGWQNLPTRVQDAVIIGIPTSILAGLLTRLLYDYLRKRSSRGSKSDDKM